MYDSEGLTQLKQEPVAGHVPITLLQSTWEEPENSHPDSQEIRRLLRSPKVPYHAKSPLLFSSWARWIES